MWEFKIFLIISFLLIPGIIITADSTTVDNYATSSVDSTTVDNYATSSVDTITVDNYTNSSVDTIPIGIDAYPADTFVSVWDTTLIASESSKPDQITLPLIQTASYNFQIDWGDGTTETISSDVANHTYSTTGKYEIQIEGTFGGWYFYQSGDRLKLLEIKQWGTIGFGNSGFQFSGAENLQITATDAPNLSDVSDLSHAFAYCHNLTTTGNFNSWDVSSVADMEGMFYYASSFNQSLNSWDVSSVTNMAEMFEEADSFNQPLDNWDVSSVTNMSGMFSEAYNFKQSLNSWNVSSVTDMEVMFADASSFNQPLSSWNTSSVTNMFFMFAEARSFNQPLDNWDVSSVTDMSGMFERAYSFNQPLNSWDVSSVTDMSYMFENAHSFNQPLNSWDISSVTDMFSMFYNVKLSTQNYDRLLNSWANQNVQSNIVFNGGMSQYSSAAADARQSLIDDFSWIIYDGGHIGDNISTDGFLSSSLFFYLLLGTAFTIIASAYWINYRTMRTRQSNICPICGYNVPLKDNFCSNCGNKFERNLEEKMGNNSDEGFNMDFDDNFNNSFDDNFNNSFDDD